MKSWVNKRPGNWSELKKAGAQRWFKETGSGSFSFPHFEYGADALYEAMMEERPCEEEWRLKILAIEFGEISVPDFLKWLREKSLVREDD